MSANVIIRDADDSDAAEILALQRIAYQSEAAIYQDFALPPLLETIEEVRAAFGAGVVLKAESGGRIVGSVRGRSRDGVCLISRLIVHPELRDRGIGTRLMQAIEERFADASRYELFTGHRSERNLHLYAKLGYSRVRTEPVHERLTLIHLAKSGQQSG